MLEHSGRRLTRWRGWGRATGWWCTRWGTAGSVLCCTAPAVQTDCGELRGGPRLRRDIIAQSVNTGSDVSNIQFDLQVGRSVCQSSDHGGAGG